LWNGLITSGGKGVDQGCIHLQISWKRKRREYLNKKYGQKKRALDYYQPRQRFLTERGVRGLNQAALGHVV